MTFTSSESIATWVSYSFGAIAIVVALLVHVDCTLSLENVRTEAVKRGYAEWYSEDGSSMPTLWRWKETTGEQ